VRVLVACEFSGTVRDAMNALGHSATSCDLLPTEAEGSHIVGDALQVAYAGGWDMMIAHPPCTYLTVAGNKWMKPEYAAKYPTRIADRDAAVKFFMALYNAPISKVAIENPIGIMSSRFREPDCIVQPWMFGHPETKATCFWLRGLPPLIPTHMRDDMFAEREPEGREQRLHKLPPGPDRWKERSKTFPGIARAIALQWAGDMRAAA
jgi:hypothetical protein